MYKTALKRHDKALHPDAKWAGVVNPPGVYSCSLKKRLSADHITKLAISTVELIIRDSSEVRFTILLADGFFSKLQLYTWEG